MEKIKKKKSTIEYRNVMQKISDKFRKKSVWMIHYCTGCGAIELPPTMTSRWDMERYGMQPMVTSRQADVLLITGYLAIKTLKRVITVYEQMIAPKYVVAFGSCPINGGMYYKSYSTIKQLDKYIPVDLWIAGCMPRPEAVMSGFKKLEKLIDEGKAVGWKKYEKNYKWYKKNQDEIFNNFGVIK